MKIFEKILGVYKKMTRNLQEIFKEMNSQRGYLGLMSKWKSGTTKIKMNCNRWEMLAVAVPDGKCYVLIMKK